MLDAVEEGVAVAVDLLDAHRRDHLAKLAEDDVLCLTLDLLVGEAEEADGGLLPDVGLGADDDREDARHRDANVLGGERVLERDVLDRFEGEVRVLPDQRPDEGRAVPESSAGPSSFGY